MCSLAKNVIDRSMTILAETMVGCAVLLKMSLTGQWQFKKKAQKVSLTGQWQFWLRPWWDVQSYWKCHWPVNDSFRRKLKDCHWPLNDSFQIDPQEVSLTRQWQFGLRPWWDLHLYKMSLTGQWQFSDGSSKSVIDQSMTIWAETMVGPAPLQNVIDQSMTVFR